MSSFSIESALEETFRVQDLRSDVIRPLGQMDISLRDDGSFVSDSFGKLTEHARGQYLGQIGVNTKFFDDVVNTDMDLAYTIAERRSATFADRETTMRAVDGLGVSAILSGSYLPVDSHDLLREVSQEGILSENIIRCNVGPEGLSITCLNEDSHKVDGSHQIGDVMNTGLMLRNSEIGTGSVSLELFLHRLVCLNGMIAPKRFSGVTRRHTGRSSWTTAERVVRASNVVESIRERAGALQSAGTKFLEMIEEAAQTPLREDWQRVMHKEFPAILSKKRVEKAQAEAPTVWGAANAVTFLGHELSGQSREDVEEVGGRMVVDKRIRKLVAA